MLDTQAYLCIYIYPMTPPSLKERAGCAPLLELPCACASLRRAARAVSQLYAQEMRRSRLEPGQFGLLMALAKAGEITQGRLGQLLAIDSTTLTRTLAPLRARGWIAAKPGADRRQRRLRLTPAGRRQLRRALPYWERAQRRLRRAVGGEDWSHLLALLPQVTRRAQQA
ncbi:MAG: MarR family winged helix-turn-helix transcriptional regulator [Terriglobia bacterium]